MGLGNNGRLGTHHTEATKQKIRLANLGKKRSPEAIERMRLSKLGTKRQPHSADTKLKMSLASIGRPKSPQHKLALRLAKLGRPSPLKGRARPDLAGPNNPRWISDRSLLSTGDEARNSPAHRDWSRQIKNRDGWRCKIADSNCSGRVEAHHILGWKDYPELRYSPNNGITLCHAHHPRRRAEEKRLSAYFQQIVSASLV